MKTIVNQARRHFAAPASGAALKTTHLHAYHRDVLKAKMVPFAGYDMPVLYPEGIIKEHLHCRASVGLFDVSHMGQVRIKGKDARAFLERLTVADLQNLAPGKATLSLIMNEKGGINDDCIITKVTDDHFFMVINAGCKDNDLKYMNQHLSSGEWNKKDIGIEYNEDNSLIAVQGPKAQQLVDSILGVNLSGMDFMTSQELKYKGETIRVSRCGYTGEDGFEISVPEKLAIPFSNALETGKDVDGSVLAKWIGLGARDTLRLEAGLCLYGHELNEDISPIDAVLGWTISKRRKEQGGFLGYDRIKKELEQGVKSKRTGIIVEGPPARDGVEVTTKDGKVVGKITSGGPSPSLKKNIAQAYIDVPLNKLETELQVTLRGKQYPAIVKKMPFVPSRYYKKP